jgi:hypothetical protein
MCPILAAVLGRNYNAAKSISGDDGNEYIQEAASESGDGGSRISEMDGKSSRSRQLKSLFRGE